MSALAPALFSEYREDTRWTEAREWHHLEQDWHQQEVDWRSVDVEWMGEQRRRMALEQDWRDMDMHQRWLDNLRREVDEKVQQLATLSNLSVFLVHSDPLTEEHIDEAEQLLRRGLCVDRTPTQGRWLDGRSY